MTAATLPDTDHDRFLRCIIDRPDEDGPRLVYADWLEEDGDSDFAEFIRVSIELAGIGSHNTWSTLGDSVTPRDPFQKPLCECVWCSLSRRSAALLAIHSRTWAEPVTRLLPKCPACRGTRDSRYAGTATFNDLPCGVCKATGHDPAYSIAFDRGFAYPIGPLAGLWGETCERCYGTGHASLTRMETDCADCIKGHRPGILDAICRIAPLTTCGVGDRDSSFGRHNTFGWWNNGENDEPDDIPRAIWDKLTGFESNSYATCKLYSTAALAQSALVTALIDAVRERNGLPAIVRPATEVSA